MPPSRSAASAALWIGVPFLLYLVLLRHFWFDAPIWDDYDAILRDLMRMQDAASPREWLGFLLIQHNEHRIALARLTAWSMAAVAGHLDFRLLALAGNAGLLGILLLAWAEFRDRLPAPVFAAAACLLLQISYYEASLVSMSALSNIGVVFFAFACLFFAQRDGAIPVVATLALGAFAAAAQASGLFALPLAAALCAIRGRKARAAVAAACAALLWVLYFTSYARPVGHPSVFAALTHPLQSIHFFFVIVGSVVPNRSFSVALGSALNIALAWALRRGLSKVSPTAVAWSAFILMSVAATVVGRVGFGVHHAPRYALQSSCLAVIALLAVAALVGPLGARQAFRLAGAAALASVMITIASWSEASAYSFHARLLARGVASSPDVRSDPWFGVMYPDRVRANGILAEAAKRGLWSAREEVLLPTSVRIAANPPPEAPFAGAVDRIAQEGARCASSAGLTSPRRSRAARSCSWAPASPPAPGWRSRTGSTSRPTPGSRAWFSRGSSWKRTTPPQPRPVGPPRPSACFRTGRSRSRGAFRARLDAPSAEAQSVYGNRPGRSTVVTLLPTR